MRAVFSIVTVEDLGGLRGLAVAPHLPSQEIQKASQEIQKDGMCLILVNSVILYISIGK